ncbi:hypothetical protein AB1Y20_009953 [Prymnesium parvum]|uniref:Glycosyltransferase 2-like domain-containing protein n=1 Tax=Prymnesium parvum TaxID=97485 RepID=A0AB34K303_PRYPA
MADGAAPLRDAAAGVHSVHELVTVCIKHTSGYDSRRVKLMDLLRSIRLHYGVKMRVLVASESKEGARKESFFHSRMKVSHVPLPKGAGLSAGRNALVQAVRTPFLALMDDDVVFRDAASLATLLSALQSSPQAALAGGCYIDPEDGKDGCFNLQFHPSEDGSIVHAKQLHDMDPTGCHRVSATHNFFVARTEVLRRLQWDSRQRVMEHETFFYQLYLNQVPVLACPSAGVIHNQAVLHDKDPYERHSLRGVKKGHAFDPGAPFLQYLCHNFPEVKRFITPYVWWLCDRRRFCQANFDAEFAFDGRFCQDMPWDEDQRVATVPRRLVDPFHPWHLFPGESSGSSLTPSRRHRHVPLLVLVFSQQSNFLRREEQRKSWLSFQWHRGPTDTETVPWRYLYVYGTSSSTVEASQVRVYDTVVGDGVTISHVEESYSKLVYKTIAALRWALTTVSFEMLLKTDDDSIVHIGRVWHWLSSQFDPKERLLVYAGRIVNESQVIRPGFTREQLWHPQWYPHDDDIQRWAVAYETFKPDTFPPYCSGGGYVLGRGAAERIIQAYDKRPAAQVIPLEDAFLGVLAAESGVAIHTMPGITDLLLDKKHRQQWDDQTGIKWFQDKLLVHRVAHPRKALRWLMRAEGHPAVWMRQEAFQRSDCPGCELPLFEDTK